MFKLSFYPLAITNPESQVFLLFSYEVGFFNETPLPIIDALLSYKNIHLNVLNITEYSKNSPLEKWVEDGALFSSDYLTVHTSDVVRMLTLWKYSGSYFDLDIIVKKLVSTVGSNFACVEAKGLLNNAVLNFNSTTGKNFTENYFKKLIANFNGNSWAGNGPEILTSIAQELCCITDPLEMPYVECNGFKVLPPDTCFAIDWFESNKLFGEEYLYEVMERTKHSFAVHFWNSMTGSKITPLKFNSGDYTIKELINGVVLAVKNNFLGTTKHPTNSNSAYVQLAKRYCPRVFAVSEGYL